MTTEWQVYALKYAERNNRLRRESFIFDDNHEAPHPMDYFIWVLRNESRTIVVDTGYDQQEGARRDRPILRNPADALTAMGIQAESVDTLVLTHLHYDHAGTVNVFPNATIHLQVAEMAYATGPCMCHGTLQMPFTVDHVCELVQRVYAGSVVYHDGDAVIADGVSVHRIGGHSRGLQALRVNTASGWLCLASDATHYYENVFQRKPFPIVVDLQEMLDGFDRLEQLASNRSLIIPGHDPLICQHFPLHEKLPDIYALHHGPAKPLPGCGDT